MDLAADQRATLLVLHIVDDTGVSVGLDDGYPNYADNRYDTVLRNGRKLIAKAEAAGKAAGVDIKGILVGSRGRSVARCIVVEANAQAADVIVLGTHGRRGLRRVLMGSDAEAVVREARVPVLLVRGTAKRATRAAAAEPVLLTGSVPPSERPTRPPH